MLDATHSDLAFLNKKFVRKGFSEGTSTARHLITAMPFDNNLATGEVPVSDLNKMLAESQKRADQTSLTWQFSDSDRTFKDGAIVDNRTGQPLPGDEKLKVATIDYLLQGGLDYLPRDKYHPEPGSTNLRQVFGKYLANEGASW
jgi:2',3'-cyclic-nucleotide 2'-phosphodiesterase (5'-nucleotidase family)